MLQQSFYNFTSKMDFSLAIFMAPNIKFETLKWVKPDKIILFA